MILFSVDHAVKTTYELIEIGKTFHEKHDLKQKTLSSISRYVCDIYMRVLGGFITFHATTSTIFSLPLHIVKTGISTFYQEKEKRFATLYKVIICSLHFFYTLIYTGIDITVHPAAFFLNNSISERLFNTYTRFLLTSRKLFDETKTSFFRYTTTTNQEYTIEYLWKIANANDVAFSEWQDALYEQIQIYSQTHTTLKERFDIFTSRKTWFKHIVGPALEKMIPKDVIEDTTTCYNTKFKKKTQQLLIEIIDKSLLKQIDTSIININCKTTETSYLDSYIHEISSLIHTPEDLYKIFIYLFTNNNVENPKLFKPLCTGIFSSFLKKYCHNNSIEKFISAIINSERAILTRFADIPVPPNFSIQFYEMLLGCTQTFIKGNTIKAQQDTKELSAFLYTIAALQQMEELNFTAKELWSLSHFITFSLRKNYTTCGKKYFKKTDFNIPNSLIWNSEKQVVYIIHKDQTKYGSPSSYKKINPIYAINLADEYSVTQYIQAVNKDQIPTMQSELDIHTSLSANQGIVPLVDHVTYNKTTCFATVLEKMCLIYEKYETDLEKTLKNERLSIQQKIQIARGICQGLQLMHSKDYVHCDLNPANILLAFDEDTQDVDNVVLCDFGSSQVNSKSSWFFEQGFYSTRLFTSPELFLNTHSSEAVQNIDKKPYDMFALGLILHKMHYGSYPEWCSFNTNEINATDSSSLSIPQRQQMYKNKIQASTEPLLKQLSRRRELSLEDRYLQIMCSMLQIDPTKRITIDEAYKAFDGLL